MATPKTKKEKYIVVSPFYDKPEYANGPAETHEVGKDVSDFEPGRLVDLVQRGLVTIETSETAE